MFKTLGYCFLLGTIFSSLVNATEKKQESQEDNDSEVIVIIGKVPRPISDVFGVASVISRETIDKEMIHDIADLVRYQAGISIESAGTRFGLSGFTIRGIGGNRVATEIDGIPVADQFGIGSYSNSGRNFIDIDLVQQVEILRGPASSIYGSNAIGGVISFVTKKPIDLMYNTNQEFYLGLKAAYYGVDDSQLYSLNSAFISGKSSGLMTLSYRNGHELDNQASSNTPKDQQDNQTQSILLKYFYELSDQQELSISYDHFVRESDSNIQSLLGQGRFRSTTGLLGDDESKRENVSLNYEFTTDNSWLDGGVLRLYQQTTTTEQLTDERRLSRGTHYRYDRDFYYKQKIDGLRLNLYSDVSTHNFNHTIGYGIEWSERRVTELRNGLQTNLDNNTSTHIILSEQFPLRDFPISKIKELGIYFNDEIEIYNSHFSLIPALRFDQYELLPEADLIYQQGNSARNIVSIKETNISPKLGLEHQFSRDALWFVQYFEGFRAPPFEDANIGLDIPLFNIRAIPNPDLKSESSKGYELGYRYDKGAHQLSVVGFFTEYRDFIQTKVNLGFNPAAGRVLFQSQNISSAKIYGSEFQYSFETEHWLVPSDEVKFNFNWFTSQGENNETHQPLNNISPNHFLLGVNWNSPDSLWQVSINSSTYQAKNNVDEIEGSTKKLFKTAGYTLVDLIANYQINPNMKLSAAIYNLTDQKYWRWSDVNGLFEGDPVLQNLAASGINSSLQLRINW